MKYIDTPAGKFQILLNGTPADFEAKLHSPYSYHDNAGAIIPILACYQVALNIHDLTVGDTIKAGFAHGTLKCDGGGEGMDNAVGYIGDYVIGIGATDTQYLEWDINQRQLPYENYGFQNAGFTFHIVDNPNKYTVHSIQETISFIIAWENSSKEYARDIVSFMTS